MRFLRLLALVALPAALSGAITAQERPTWPLAIASGSQRLALMALLREQPAGAEGLTASLIAAQGFAPDSGAKLSFTATPSLTWEENLNGGIAARSLRLYGLDFVIDEASRAKAGLVPTLTLGVSARKTHAPGAVLNAFAFATAGYSFDHHLGKADVTLGLCSASSLAGDWFADICLRQTRRIRDLATTTDRTYSLGFERLFPVGDTLHSVTIRPQIEAVEDKTRPMIGLDWMGVYPDLGILSASVLGGNTPDGYGGVTRLASLGLKREVRGAQTGLTVTAETSAGQSYLGIARKDDALTVTLTRQIGTWGEARLGYRSLRSSIAGFADDTLLLGFAFAGWDR